MAGILACTDVKARDIDVADVDWVIQYDPPSSAQALLHRCGRAGRNGQPAKTLLMLLREEEPYVKFLSDNHKVMSISVPSELPFSIDSLYV